MRTFCNQTDKIVVGREFQLKDKNHQRYLEAGNTNIPINISDTELKQLHELGYLVINIAQEPTTIVFDKKALDEFANKGKKEQRKLKWLNWPWPRSDKLALIGVLIALIGLLGTWAVVPQVRQALHWDTLPPEQALTSFCKSIKSGELNTAYSEYSSLLQKQFPFEVFKQQWKKIEECTYEISSSSEDHASGSIVTKESGSNQTQTYIVTLIKDNNGNWVIDTTRVP